MMDWKLELDALIENTMAFANHVKRQPVSDLPVAVNIAEPALAATAKPAALPANIASLVSRTSERNEILRIVSTFKAHQEKMTREREHHYLQIKARMMPPMALSDDQKKSPSA